jgi:anti-anti-sigma factor
MPAFQVLEDSRNVLRLKLDAHGLDGEAQDLFQFLAPALQERRHAKVVVDGEEAYFVSLEGVATLMRLLRRADDTEVRFFLERPHPVLRRKLELTGVLDLLTES